jgi:DNA-binding NarL/FixJ family response regulator
MRELEEFGRLYRDRARRLAEEQATLRRHRNTMIQRAYAQGVPMADIAAELEISQQRVSRILRLPEEEAVAADLPELRERVAAMRADGLTLQAIADRLNEEGVPTRSGGKWRPSSVQPLAMVDERGEAD